MEQKCINCDFLLDDGGCNRVGCKLDAVVVKAEKPKKEKDEVK